MTEKISAALKNSKEMHEGRKMIVLVSGKAQHGKDTFSDALVEWTRVALGHEKSFKKFSFAAALKNSAKGMGWDGKKDVAGRRLLQMVGRVAREYNKDIWPTLACDSIKESGFPPLVVFSDFRFPNEEDYVSEWGERHGYETVTVRIERPGFDNGLSEEAKRDVSETLLDEASFDMKFVNDHDSAKAFGDCAFSDFLNGVGGMLRLTEATRRINERRIIFDALKPNEMNEALKIFESSKKPVIALDFDDTFLEKTGSIDRTPFFKRICETFNVCIVTARTSQATDVVEDFQKKGLPMPSAILFNSGDKRNVLERLRPVCIMDDSPRVAEMASKLGIPSFLVGEFNDGEYVERWLESVEEERGFYEKHGGRTLEDIALGKRSVETAALEGKVFVGQYENEESSLEMGECI